MDSEKLRRSLLGSSSSPIRRGGSNIGSTSRSSSNIQHNTHDTQTWVILMVLLTMTCFIYSHSHQRTGSAPFIGSQQLPVGWCAGKPRSTVALLMLILGHENGTRHDPYWMAVANRRAYAVEHGYPLYLVDQPLGSGQHPAWEKLVAINAVFQHSCATWVWMSDADAYVMNMQLDVAQLARHPVAHKHPRHHQCSTNQPDIIAAGACLSRINTGSLLLRNTDWTRQFVADAWHSKFIARPASWWDQAAVLHLYKLGDNKDHFCIVKQRSINALPNGRGCHDGYGTWQEGDLLVHFPGGMKSQIASMDSQWLQTVPVLPTRLQDATARPKVFVLSAYGPGLQGIAGHNVHVSMHSSVYEKYSGMGSDYDVFIAAQPEDEAANLGWPIDPVPLEFKALVRRQLVVRRDEAWRQPHQVV